MATTQSQSSESQSTSVPVITPTPQSNWSLNLAQLLGQLGQQQYQWAMNEYARAGRVTDASIDNFTRMAQQGAGLAGNLIGRYTDQYAPLEDTYAREAQTYDSEARRMHAMGAAEARAQQAHKAAQINAENELEGFGVDPSSGRYQDLVLASNTQAAADAAAAGEQARLATEQEGQQRKLNAIRIGQQLPGAGVNALQSAYTGVAGATNAALGLANAGANLSTTASRFFDPAMHPTQPLQGQQQQSTSSSRGSSMSSPDNGGGARSGGGGGTSGNPNGGRGYEAGGGNGGGYNPMGGWGGSGGSPTYGGGQGGQPYPGFVPVGQSPGAGVQDAQGGNWDQYGGWDQPDGSGGAFDTPGQPWETDNSAWAYGDYGGASDFSDFGGWDQAPVDNGGWDESGFESAYPQDNGNWGGGGQEDFAGWGDYAQGGQVGGMPNGGGGRVHPSMSPSGGQMVDDVPAVIQQTGQQARLNADEYVIPRDVALWKGQEFFQNLINKSRKARSGVTAKPSMQHPGGRNA